jgi:uncharacterized protein
VSELVVDGYNIAYAWPELAPLIKAGQVEEARRRLVGMLGEYAAASGERVTVVFDAHGRARDHGGGESIDGVTVIFGSSAQTADHVIERRVSVAAQRGDARGVTVATGDRLQREMVMAMGAAVMSAEALRREVLGVKAHVDEHGARRRREAGFANRLEDGLDPQVRRRLEELRRAPPHGGKGGNDQPLRGDAATNQPARSSVDTRLTRAGGISYLHIPAVDVSEAANFYEAVFDWKIRGRDTARPSFDDATGHVSGAWMTGRAVSREAGLLPYIYVDNIADTVQKIEQHGGEIVVAPRAEGNLWVATFRDPAGNVLGLWHEDPR